MGGFPLTRVTPGKPCTDGVGIRYGTSTCQHRRPRPGGPGRRAIRRAVPAVTRPSHRSVGLVRVCPARLRCRFRQPDRRDPGAPAGASAACEPSGVRGGARPGDGRLPGTRLPVPVPDSDQPGVTRTARPARPLDRAKRRAGLPPSTAPRGRRAARSGASPDRVRWLFGWPALLALLALPALLTIATAAGCSSPRARPACRTRRPGVASGALGSPTDLASRGL